MNTDKEVAVRLLTVDDAELLALLATQIYKQYYTHLWMDEGAWYTDHSYGVDKIRQELSDLNNFHYIVYSSQKPVGYLKLRLGEIWKGLEEIEGLEIQRIYVLREAAGSGLGKKLMNIAFEVAKYHNQKNVFLKAMDSSTNSIGFYQRLGFEIVDTLVLPYEQMKIQYRGMVVLSKRFT